MFYLFIFFLIQSTTSKADVNTISCIKTNIVLQKTLFSMQVPRFHNNIPGEWSKLQNYESSYKRKEKWREQLFILS